MKQEIVFILGVLFAANAGYSGSQYNQNARSKCPYIYSIATGPVFNENGIIGYVDSSGKFESDEFIGRVDRVDCYGLVRDSNNKILGSVMKKNERPIYSKNQDGSWGRLLYVSRPKADDSVIVRTFDGNEFEPNGKGDAAEKEVDRWYTNWTILRNMENVFVNDICKTEYENGFQVTSDFRIENTTTESKKDSVKYNVAKNAKAIIHNHPADDNKSHAWPSLTDIISGLKNPDKGCYIVDCYDKATLIRFDQETGKIHKIQDGGHEVIAENLEPDFQNVPAYKELKKELEKVTTMEELEALLEKKAPAGMGYKYAYGNMPYVPADFELLKKKVMSLRAAEKNKSGTLQNASREVGNDAGKAVVAKTDADEAKDSNDKGKAPESVTVDTKDDGGVGVRGWCKCVNNDDDVIAVGFGGKTSKASYTDAEHELMRSRFKASRFHSYVYFICRQCGRCSTKGKIGGSGPLKNLSIFDFTLAEQFEDEKKKKVMSDSDYRQHNAKMIRVNQKLLAIPEGQIVIPGSCFCLKPDLIMVGLATSDKFQVCRYCGWKWVSAKE
jgi:hypothetical protein